MIEEQDDGWLRRVGAALTDSVGFVYRPQATLQRLADKYAVTAPISGRDQALVYLFRGLSAVYLWWLLFFSCMLPLSLLAVPIGVDSHIAHVRTRIEAGLSDDTYAASRLPQRIVELSDMPGSYDWQTGRWSRESSITLPTGRQVRSRMRLGLLGELARDPSTASLVARSERLSAAYEEKRRLDWAELGSMTPSPSDRIVLSELLAELIVDRWKERWSEDSEEWFTDPGWMMLLDSCAFVPIALLCWMRFATFCSMQIVLSLFSRARASALAALSRADRNSWSTFVVGYYLLPAGFACLQILALGEEIPPEMLAVLAVFGEQSESLLGVWFVTLSASAMIAAGFYRLVEWLTAGCVIAVTGGVSPRVSLAVTNVVAISVLLTVDVRLPQVVFAMVVALFVEVPWRNVRSWVRDRAGAASPKSR